MKTFVESNSDVTSGRVLTSSRYCNVEDETPKTEHLVGDYANKPNNLLVCTCFFFLY